MRFPVFKTLLNALDVLLDSLIQYFSKVAFDNPVQTGEVQGLRAILIVMEFYALCRGRWESCSDKLQHCLRILPQREKSLLIQWLSRHDFCCFNLQMCF